MQLQSTPLNRDTLVPDNFSRLTEITYRVNADWDMFIPGDLSQLSGADCIFLIYSHRVDLSILNHFVNRSEHYKTGTERETELDHLQEAITALDIILKELPKSKAISLGRTFYYKPRTLDESNNIGGGRWIWDGFSQSVRPGQWKPFINIDKSCGVFVKPQPLLDFIRELIGTDDINRACDPNNRKNRNKITDHLADLRILTNHLKYPKRQRIVNRGTLLRSARDEIFEKDGKKLSVEKYFLQQYQVKLDYPLIPCINVGEFSDALLQSHLHNMFVNRTC